MGTRIVLALAATLCAPTLCASASSEGVPARNVLAIFLGAEDFPSNPILDAGLREAFASRSDVPIEYFAEYLESDRFPEEEPVRAFGEYIRRKYEGRRIDLVIAMTDIVLRFVLAHREELFPDAAIVFLGLAAPGETVRSTGRGLTGMTVGIAYGETLKLALQLQPSTQQVFVIARQADGQTVESAQAEFRDFLGRIRLTYLNEETVPRLLARVKDVPPGSVILYVWQSQDEPGHRMYPDEVAGLVAQVAPVPVYGTSDFYIGSGVVGGVVRGTRESGVRIGEMVLRILTGTRPWDIPIEAARVAPVLDWRQLQRWGISDARVPAGALVRFREPSTWDRYSVYILGASAVLLAQTVLIAGLLVQRTRRRHAEEQLRGSQAELSTSYGRIRDLGSRLLEAQEAERSRVARELHDDISQQVALLEIDLELLGHAVQGQTEALAFEALTRTQGIAKSVHDLSHRLHPAKLRLIGLVAALEGLRRELSRSDIAITFTHDQVPPTLPLDLTLCLFRIVQEALQNALKHGRARVVAVNLRGGPKGLALSVVDDGIGFDVDAAWSKGLGLISMAERLEAIHGTLVIRSSPGAGTRLEITAPLDVVRSSEAAAV